MHILLALAEDGPGEGPGDESELELFLWGFC